MNFLQDTPRSKTPASVRLRGNVPFREIGQNRLDRFEVMSPKSTLCRSARSRPWICAYHRLWSEPPMAYMARDYSVKNGELFQPYSFLRGVSLFLSSQKPMILSFSVNWNLLMPQEIKSCHKSRFVYLQLSSRVFTLSPARSAWRKRSKENATSAWRKQPVKRAGLTSQSPSLAWPIKHACFGLTLVLHFQ